MTPRYRELEEALEYIDEVRQSEKHRGSGALETIARLGTLQSLIDYAETVAAAYRRLEGEASRLEAIERAAKQIRCERCSVQMSYPHLDPKEPCFSCGGLRAALRGTNG